METWNPSRFGIWTFFFASDVKGLIFLKILTKYFLFDYHVKIIAL